MNNFEKKLEETMIDAAKLAVKIMKKYRSRKLIETTLKADNTYLTKADIEISEAIANLIISRFPDHNVVSEEHQADLDFERCQWILDPIDGTSQFADLNKTEFCSAIAFLTPKSLHSSAIGIPEFTSSSSVFYANLAKRRVTCDGKNMKSPALSGNFSITRSGGLPLKIDEKMQDLELKIKKRTTSQSLDMLRVACHLDQCSSFDGFVRYDQNIWDGLPGAIMNMAMGNTVNLSGIELGADLVQSWKLRNEKICVLNSNATNLMNIQEIY